MLHNFSIFYAKWLKGRFAPDKPPPVAMIVIIFPLVLLWTFWESTPVYSALRQGAPMNSYVHQEGVSHGTHISVTTSIQDVVYINVAVVAICVPLLLCAAALMLGWFGSEVDWDD